MLIQTWFTSIGLLILLASSMHHFAAITHQCLICRVEGRGGGRKMKKKRTEKATKCKSFPLLTYHFPTKPFHHSIVSLQIFAMWFFSMAFGYGIKQVNWWFLPVNATPESLKCIDAVPARSLIHHTNHQWIGTTAHRQYKRNFAYIQFFGYDSKASKCFTTIISTNSWLMNSSQVNSKATSNCNTTCSMSNFLQNQSCTCYVGLCDSM